MEAERIWPRPGTGATPRPVSELKDQPPPGAARFQLAVGLGGLSGRDHPGHPQRHPAILHLLAQLIQLGLLAGVVPDENRVNVMPRSSSP